MRTPGKPLVFLAASTPLAVALARALGLLGGLGADPIETLLHHFGEWGLRLLLVTLAITPLRRITGKARLVSYRRMLGLFAFFYVSLHFAVYLLLDQSLDLAAVLEDVLERPYITIGFTAFLLLIPLAVTSTNAMRRRLGRHWQRLHNLVYAAALLGVWHFWWGVKKDLTEPIVYATLLTALLGYRLWYRWRGRPGRARAPA